jgi:hypothetical protein
MYSRVYVHTYYNLKQHRFLFHSNFKTKKKKHWLENLSKYYCYEDFFSIENKSCNYEDFSIENQSCYYEDFSH